MPQSGWLPSHSLQGPLRQGVREMASRRLGKSRKHRPAAGGTSSRRAPARRNLAIGQANLAELSEHSDEISERARFSQKFPIFAKSNAIASVFMNGISLFHGSDHIVEHPTRTGGKIHNDFGQGFYCTTDLELAREWACGWDALDIVRGQWRNDEARLR